MSSPWEPVGDCKIQLKHERYPNNHASLVTDVLAKGEQKLKSSTLTTFNKKVCTLMSGYCVEEEVDDIPRTDYAEIGVEDEDDMRGPEE